MEIATKPVRHYPPHFRLVATIPGEIKNSYFCRYSADMEENANKLHPQCIDFVSAMRVTVHAECIYAFLFL